jgi:hypothetical protein
VDVSQRLKVATEALAREASVWEQQAAPLREIVTKAESLTFGVVLTVLFVGLKQAHENVRTEVAARCAEGGAEMQRIAETLRAVARVHEQQLQREIDGVQRLQQRR